MTPAARARPCPVCGSAETAAHAPPHPERSMISDGRVIAAPLRKASCAACGAGFHAEPLSEGDVAAFYAGDYAVGFADAAASAARVQAVVALIENALSGDPRPARALEFGCGAGDTLRALRARFPGLAVFGVEPAPAMAAQARAAGLDVAVGMVEDHEAAVPYDLILSVNVIEHAADPGRALARVAALLAPGGIYVQIAPDADRPGLELLFRDHVSSLSAAALARLGAAAGLSLRRTRALDGALGEFRVGVFDRGGDAPPPPAPAGIVAARSAFLERVGSPPAGAVGDYRIFGAGEMANLLAAYQPALVAGAQAFVVDAPAAARRFDRPLVATASLPPGSRLVVAVHPRAEAAVAARLSAMGHEPVMLGWRREER